MPHLVHAWPAHRLDYAHAVAHALTAQASAGRHALGDEPRRYTATLKHGRACLHADTPMWPERDRPAAPRAQAPEHPALSALLQRVRGQG